MRKMYLIVRRFEVPKDLSPKAGCLLDGLKRYKG